jgi:VWFA-related protein
MSFALAAGLLLAQAGVPASGAGGAQVRSLLVTFTDAKGAPLEGLAPEEVVVMENGLARDVVGLSLDRRPLTLLLLLDTSANMGASLRLNLLDPLLAFLGALPEGSKYSLWTTGDRPTKLVDYTTDVAEASRALKRVAPQGGNTLLDALVEASEGLKQKEGERSAVLAVTKVGIEFSSRDRYRVVDEALANASLFMAVQVEVGAESFENRSHYDYALGELTRKTGGIYEVVVSAMGVGSALQKIGATFKGQYRIRYATVPEIKNRKLEVKVSRPGVRVRVGLGAPDRS